MLFREIEFIGLSEENIRKISAITGEEKLFAAIGRAVAAHCRMTADEKEYLPHMTISIVTNKAREHGFDLTAVYRDCDKDSKIITVIRWDANRRMFVFL